MVRSFLGGLVWLARPRTESDRSSSGVPPGLVCVFFRPVRGSGFRSSLWHLIGSRRGLWFHLCGLLAYSLRLWTGSRASGWRAPDLGSLPAGAEILASVLLSLF